MPPKLSIPPPPQDPLGIALVSGFYGPGAWTGWLCAVLTSWYTIVQKPDGENVHDVFLHVAYTNWAAIDLARQMLRLRAVDATARQAELSMYGELGAAITVTTWGGMHVFLQLWICLAQRKSTVFTLRLSFWRRWLILALGLLVPSLTLALFIHFETYGESESEHNISAFIPGLYFSGITEMYPIHVFKTVAAFAQMQFVFAVGALIYVTMWSGHLLVKGQTGLDLLGIVAYFGGVLWFLFSGQMYRLLSYWTFWLFPVFIVIVFGYHLAALLGSVVFVGMYVVKMFGSRGQSVQESCFFMPCAPQGISEWDQSFTVFCGLSMFVYEVGPACWRVSRTVGKRMRRLVMRGRRQASFYTA